MDPLLRTRVRDLLRRHQHALNRHDVATLARLYADDAVLVSPMFETVRGREAIARSYHHLFSVFPDYAVTMRDSLFLCEGERAAEFSVVTATQQGEFHGLPPTGQAIEYHAARLFTVQNDLIVYEQRIYDLGDVLDRIEKTRLDRELSVASAVQQTLMARTTSRGVFFEVAGASVPCRAIGGDFLECFDLPSGEFGLALGDVSGKGPAAALIAAMLQGMMSMLAGEETLPQHALRRLNTGLCRRNIEPRYATLFYGILSPSGRLSYSNAGHTPPLLVSRHEIRPLTAGGPILGVFASEPFPAETIQVDRGDTLVVYSDGVTDAAAPDGSDLGVERLTAAIHECRGASPHEMVEALLEVVRRFSDTAQQTDDATIAVLRYG